MRVLRSTDGGEGGAAKPEVEPAVALSASPPPADRAVTDLISKHGDSASALRTLLADRDKLTAELAEIRKQLPKAGHAVFDPDTVKSYEAYKGLGTPDEVKLAVYERDELRAWKANQEREKFVGEVSANVGYKASVLSALLSRDEVELVLVDGKDRVGRPAKVAAIAVEGGTVPLDEYAKKHWGDFLPALQTGSVPKLAASSPFSPYRPSGSPPRPAIVPDKKLPSLVR